ncbi:AMP-binding protein [Sulfitobacter donghicola]|uniref:4-chlorobenzoate--CoA ligase n=1 Tax=Sulfitobacter donghicola DSW-25 = KCTC 12864 = JCM 14565 TaxID=1300350 RepID=A0A073IEV9_9RHOB|nr:AMP-binding protein [Sulfitobacter donghicola]KEJ88903.1 4-chlorobenzoate--CoA ligase [Sulfitobacter donghicola DSW-25 = KCTC 12864 = JCM 14565]KIN67558.1 4-chlorobenzoate--CoA ligase [Sulfitobacter donghicola DSW-25 = KCTC 12864 = JCM 14565]
MLDLGTSFLASVERDPDAMAIAEGDQTITYADWYRRISALVDGLGQIGLRKGDTLVTAMQNRWENASLHWACQIAGIVITPVNWRVTADELDHALHDSAARVLVHDDAASEAVAGSALVPNLKVLPLGGDQGLAAMLSGSAADAAPQAGADDLSVMLYTSGTTSKPKGVPRRHRAERAAAIAHVAQNMYGHGERTLGVMPLYHTMGIRSLLSASVIGGAFVCLPRFDVPGALAAIEQHRVSNLYLVPTLYHDIVHHAAFTPDRVASVRKLGFAGASMTDGLLQKLAEAFQPELFVNHYGSSEIYTFSICQDAAAKPGSAGRAAINQRLRVVPLGATDASQTCAPGEEGEIVASMQGDEAFEGYWNRPEADRKAIRDGWYFTGDCGLFDEDGDLFVTGRADDMIITGGENVSPVEVESCLSLHPAVAEVAVVGLPDVRWGKVVTAFVKRGGDVTEDDLDAHCRSSDLSNFRRPRRYVFVREIPKSPVGKLLRRLLVAGEYEVEPAETTTA